MPGSTLPAHIEALLSPDSYPHAVERVELRQTHISYVFLAGDVVYKIKKPLDLGFLDYTTLQKRKHYCDEEVRLNRRLCADTYLGVVPIVPANGSFRVDGQGEAIDYAVKMRRLPDESMMHNIIERDAVTSAQLRSLAQRLAEFHAISERSEEIDRYGGLETAMANWRENFDQTRSFIGRTITRTQVDDIEAFIDGIATADAELFAQRVREGRARDCHGDLRSDAVCFEGDHVCIMDCIEFNERFRYSDVAADIAFLAMDLDFRGRRDLSDELMGLYLGETLDSTLPLVLPFYKCYRAYVRGKVDGFQLDQPEVDAEQKSRATAAARAYFELAHAYAMELTPRTLIITIGVTGSGKSYLGNALAARLGAAIISSDVVRKGLQGIESRERQWVPFEAGIYSPEATEQAYRSMLDAARVWLERDKPVVLDASFLKRPHREAAVRLAMQTDSRFLAIECEAAESVIIERLTERRGDERVVSDGRWEIYQAQQERRDPVDELPVGSHAVIETEQPLRKQIEDVLAHLAGHS